MKKRVMLSIVEASESNSPQVAQLVEQLLIELEPHAREDIQNLDLNVIAKELLHTAKIQALLVKKGDNFIAVLTLHECAALYAGGVFGEISELYVLPEYRSSDVGHLLVEAAIEKARQLGWQRLEVGTPPPDQWPRTTKFYKQEGFKFVGQRFRYLLTDDS